MKQHKKWLILTLIFIIVFGFTGYFPKPARAANLISDWQFNLTANDSAGTNDGTLQGSASVGSGYLNLSSSTGDYVSVPDDDSLSFVSGGVDQPFSISVWVKKNTGNDLNILSKGSISGDNLEYDLYMTANDSINFRLFSYQQIPGEFVSFSYYAALDYDSSYLNGNWLNIALTYDGTGGTNGAAAYKFYFNGSAVNYNLFTTASRYYYTINDTGDLWIGRTSTGYSDGAIDDLRVFDGVLTANEVNVIFTDRSLELRDSKGSAYLKDANGNDLSSLNTPVATAEITYVPANELNTNDGIMLSFASGFTLGTFDGTETVITQLNNTQNITEGTVDKDTQDVRIKIGTPAGDNPAAKVTITITGQITTPATDGTYLVNIKSYDLGTDNAWGGVDGAADTLEGTVTTAFVFGDYNVDITASVDPTLTLSLESFYDASGNVAASHTCNLSTSSKILINTEINLCLYAVIVSTNGAGGYTAYVRDTGNLSTGIDEMIDAGLTMSPNPATAEYGIATTAAGRTINQINDFDGGGVGVAECTYLWTNGTQIGVNSSAITETDQDFAGATSPVDTDTTVLCHMAAIAGDTPNGTYTTTTIITAVGNF